MATSETPPASPIGPPPDATVRQESALRRFQSLMAGALALSPAQRRAIAHSMMVRAPASTVSYWLQLCLSVGIATFGLVLNSSGVVIGAMLIAPLMGPIVELAMALTIGSPYMMLRSLHRAVISMVVAVVGSAVINIALPYHEVTSEIIARTTPTAIDLFVAVFCAFAAAFSVVRAGSETVSTAAGTSISIALVPPLCVVGFGLGNQQSSVATGAALLFVANLSAILMFAALFFFALGFDTVPAQSLEQEAQVERSRLGRLSAHLWHLYGRRYGAILRILLPLSLVGGVSIPLSQALSTVAWEVRVRGRVKAILQREIPTERSVQSTVMVQNRQVSLRVVLVAKPERGKQIEERLRLRVAEASGVTPTIHVLSVPDEQTIRDMALSLQRSKSAPLVAPQAEPDISALLSRISSLLKSAWPEPSVGTILSWQLRVKADELWIEVSHLGNALGPPAETMLGQQLGRALDTTVHIHDRPIDPRERVFELNEPQKYWPELWVAIASVQEHSALQLCVGMPDSEPTQVASTPSAIDPRDKAAVDAIKTALHDLGPRALIQKAGALRWKLQDTPCQRPAPPDAGAEPDLR